MADPAHIEAIQARLRNQGVVMQRMHVLRHLLSEFDPQDTDQSLDYRGLLRRAYAILARAMDALSPESPVVTHAAEEAQQLLADAKEGA